MYTRRGSATATGYIATILIGMTGNAGVACRHIVTYVGLGSNVGDRLGWLRWAVEHLTLLSGGVRTSGVYETGYVGSEVAPQPMFLNAVAECIVAGSADELLVALQEIERDAGRSAVDRAGPRTLDLDLLLFDDLERSDPLLVLPHPRMWERAFVLAPLAELAPSLVGPSGEAVGAVATRLMQSQGPIRRIRESLPYGPFAGEQTWEHSVLRVRR